MARNIALEECSFVNESSHAFTGSAFFQSSALGLLASTSKAPSHPNPPHKAYDVHSHQRFGC